MFQKKHRHHWTIPCVSQRKFAKSVRLNPDFPEAAMSTSQSTATVEDYDPSYIGWRLRAKLFGVTIKWLPHKMIHKYIISCGNHFIVNTIICIYIYIHTFVHIFVRHKSLSWQEDMFITTDPPMNLQWTYRDWRRNHQPGRKVSVSPLSGAKYPSQSQNHPRAPSCRPLPICGKMSVTTIWETVRNLPLFPNEFGEKGPYPKDKYRLSRCPV